MRWKWSMPVVLTVLLAAGCSSQQSAQTTAADKETPASRTTQEVQQQKISIHNRSILKKSPDINIKYPEISGMKDKAAQTRINESLKNSANLKDESALDEDFDPSMPSSFSSEYRIAFQNDHLIEFLYDQYLYPSGAAHGMPSLIPIMVDLDNGRIVTPDELINDPSGARQIISQIVLKEDVMKTLDGFGDFNQITADDLQNIYITKDGLTIFFPPYEYASFADGTLKYHLSFADIKSVINASFFKSHGIDIAKPNTTTTLYLSEGYHFAVPTKWMERLTFERADYSEDNIWSSGIDVYYNSEQRPLLFSIHGYEKQKWASVTPGTEVKLTADNDWIYSYSVAKNGQDNGTTILFKKSILPAMMKTFELDY